MKLSVQIFLKVLFLPRLSKKCEVYYLGIIFIFHSSEIRGLCLNDVRSFSRIFDSPFVRVSTQSCPTHCCPDQSWPDQSCPTHSWPKSKLAWPKVVPAQSCPSPKLAQPKVVPTMNLMILIYNRPCHLNFKLQLGSHTSCRYAEGFSGL